MTYCPDCGSVLDLATMLDEEAEMQVHALELDTRRLRSKVTRLEREREAQAVSRRDGKVWADVLAYWQTTFPEVQITAKGIKSERATVFFQRLDAGSTVDDVKLAIRAAREWPFIVFGKRQRSGSRSDRACDLVQICKGDAQFDALVERGREMAADE